MFIYPTSIYGFNEGNTEYKLSDETLEEFKEVKCFISEIDTNEPTELFYGIECEFEPHTGKFIISKEKKDIMKNMFHKIMEFKTNKDNDNLECNDNSHFIIPELGYYICLGGDVDYSNYQIYNINNSNINDSHINDLVSDNTKEEYKYHESSDSDFEDSQFLNERSSDSDITPRESSEFSD
jgi:hypothetical protein